MAPRLNLFATRNVLRHITTQQSTSTAANRWNTTQVAALESSTKQWLGAPRIRRQAYSSKKAEQPEEAEQPKGPTQDTLPDVSHEAAAMDKILSGKKCDGNAPGSPELEQGTPIDEVRYEYSAALLALEYANGAMLKKILKRDEEALKYAPKVLRDQANKKGTRSYSTSARLFQQDLQQQPFAGSPDDASAAMVESMIMTATDQAIERDPGLKFDMPDRLPKSEHFKNRYDPLVEQFTKLMMEDGKLSKAQRDMEIILNHLRTSSPPKLDPRRRLLTALPAPQLPLNPVVYLNILVDSIAPLIKIRQQKGLTGGGASVPMPVPLSVRQRRRTAIMWILSTADKRKDSQWAMRVANELTSIAEGRSGVWEKREQVHKIGVAGRTNLQLAARR